MYFLNTYVVWLLLLLSWPLQSNAHSAAEKFDPEKYIPVERHYAPICGSGPDPDDDEYDDDDDGGGREPGTPVCPNDTNPPTIWILEDGTRFMNSLKNGQKSSISKGLLDIRGIFHDTGACYRFVSLEDNLGVEQMTDLITGLVKENKIRTILLIVEYDQLETLPESSSLKHQMRIIQYLLGDKTFHNLFLIVGHPFGQDDKTARREAEDKFSKMFQWLPEDIELFPMSNSLNLYGDIFKEKRIKNAIDGSLVSIEKENQPPILLSDMGTKIEQAMFSVTSFFSASEGETWQLEWLLGGKLLWRVEGHAEGVISAKKESVEGVIETNQEVTYITKNLYAAKVWIMPKGQKIMTIEIDVSGKLSNISVAVSVWNEWEAWSGCNIYLEKTRKRQTENGKETQTEKKKCDITSITNPNFCQGFEEYPGPRILFLGGTGTGKSTLGNILMGVSKGQCLEKQCIKCNKGFCKPGQCEKRDSKGVCEKCKAGQCKIRKRGACIGGKEGKECVRWKNYKLGKPMNETEKLPFEPGSDIDSKTVDTDTFSGQFLGSGPCVTLIDTPGAADSKGRDYEHAIKMAEFLKEDMKSFDAILLMLKGSDRRFTSHTIALLKLYEEIFGKEMWRNVIVEMSYWQHTKQAACDRKNNMSVDELKQGRDINTKLRQEFDVKHKVPIVFIDPVFGGFDPNKHVEIREVDIFKNQTINLWKIVKEMKKYECSENCQAPPDFYTGTPWLESANKTKVEDGQANFVVPCKIWNGITSGDSSHKNSDMMKWFFRGEEIFSQDYGKDPIFKTKILKTYGFDIVPPKSSQTSMFAISTLTIKRVNGKQHQGVFKCENKKGKDEWKLSIPFWSEWGAWSQCTKSCRNHAPLDEPGKQKRTRECEGHQNEVNTCSSSKGGKEDVQDCKISVFCPVERVVTDWSTWTSCSPSCGNGTRSRSRTCTPGMFNLIDKYNLCPTKNNEPYEAQEDICSDGPCPRNCKFGEWGDWGSCKPKCAKDTNVKGQKKRNRSVLEQAIGGGTCDATKDATSCQVTECPVDGKWGEWHEGTCISPIGCGKGRQDKWRSCEGRKGAGKACRTSNGYENMYEPKNVECFTKACPIDCVLGDWEMPFCQASCDSHKVVIMSRAVNTKAEHGGKECGETSKSYRCYGNPCPKPPGGCYSQNSLVTLSSGNSVKMSSLKIGDIVEISDENGVHGFSEFVGWMEKDKTQKVSFYKLTTESGNVLVMTGSHGLFIENNGIVSATFANSLEIGDSLILSNQSNGTKTERLVLISMVAETGWLDPLTKSGTIMVNNISTSCYASFPHWLANLALLPARQWPNIFLDDAETEERDGTREYIHFIKHVGRLFSSSGFRIDDKYSEASKDIGLFKYFERSFSFSNLRIGDKNLQDIGVTIVWFSMMAGFLGILLQQMYKK